MEKEDDIIFKEDKIVVRIYPTWEHTWKTVLAFFRGTPLNVHYHNVKYYEEE